MAVLTAFAGAAVPVASLMALQNPQDPAYHEVFTSFTAQPSQVQVQVALDADGDTIVVFTGYGYDGDGSASGVKLLKIDAFGRFIAPGGAVVPTGEPFLVNTTTTGAQKRPAVAVDQDGDFIVVWEGGPDDMNDYEIFFRRFTRDLLPVGSEVKITTIPAGSGESFTDPAVAMDDDGDFVIAWIDNLALYGVRAQRFTADGSPNGGQFNVSNQTGYSRSGPRVAMDAQGDFAVAWTSNYQDGSGAGVFARAFAANGSPRAGEFRVNTVTSFTQQSPDIAMDHDGNFVVVWSDINGQAQRTVDFQRYDATGLAVGSNTAVTDVGAGDEQSPSVGMAADGDFVIAWDDYSADPFGAGSEVDAPGIFARRFSADGTPIATQFHVNATTAGFQGGVDVALDADGDFGVGYYSDSGNGTIGSGPLMLFQRFTGGEPVNVSIRQAVVDTNPVGADTEYTYQLRIGNSHAVPAVAGVGTATGVAVDLYSLEGAFNGVVEPGWDCGPGGFCAASGFCITCISSAPIPAGRQSSLTVRLQAPPAAGTATTSFAVNTNQFDPKPANNAFSAQRTIAPVDTVPDAFDFPDQFNVAPGSVRTSEPVTVSGIDAPTPITVAGGRYSKNGGSFTTAEGTVVAGDTIIARHTAADTLSTVTTTRVTIGGVIGRFRSTTTAADDTPDPFTFAPVIDAPLATQQVSNGITVKGINVPAAITVANGQYNINGSAFTATGGTVARGDVVRVRRKSSPDASTTLTATLTIGGVSAGFDVRTADDLVPDAFAFTAQDGVPAGSVRTSNPVTVGGISAPAPIGVSGGTYSIDGGAFTTANGTVSPGAHVRLRQKASDSPGTTTTATLTIGGVVGSFAVTTEAPDQSPDPFAFASQSGVPVGSVRVSSPITVSGISVPTPISVSRGQYRINAGSFTSAAGTVSSGDTVIVQQTAADAPSTTRTTTLTIGDRTGTFATTTQDPDVHPNPFVFGAQAGVPLNAQRVSNAIVVGGINAAVDIGVTNGEYSVNNLAFTSAPGRVRAGDNVRVRHTSAPVPATTVTTTLSIGDVAGNFRSTTVPEDATPDAFAFVDQSGVSAGSVVTSNTIVVSGINVAVPVSVTGGSYRINGGTYTTEAGTVVSGDQVRVRASASGTPGATIDAVLVIGGVSDTFSVTTAP